MPWFFYRAYDKAGLEVEGRLEAGNPEEARSRVRERGLFPLALDEVESGDGAIGGIFGGDQLSLGDRARFARRLAALLKGGVPLSRALAGFEQQEETDGIRRLYAKLREGVEGGRDLSVIMGELGEAFDPWSRCVVRVGETTGKLDLAFSELAGYFTRVLAHRRRLIGALTYPTIMAVVACGTVVFLLTYLMPMIQRLFADMQGKLPLITRLLIAVGDLLRAVGPWAVLAGFLGLLATRLFLKRGALRAFCDPWLDRVPVFGGLRELSRREAWARNLGMMLRCGVSLMEAIRVAAETSDSPRDAELMEELRNGLTRGKALSVVMKESGRFPPIITQMVEAGEASGDLAGMLELVAGELEADFSARSELFLNLLEPLLVLFMGVVVGAIMIGVLLPIYEMNRLI